MIELELLGVEPRGEALSLNDAEGNRYSLSITDELRAALRRDVPVSTPSPKPITPREIQALFRAGKTVDDVADMCALPPTQLLALERPITAERLYTAAQARSYRQAHELGGMTIEELVVSRLVERGVTPEGITWDTYREAGAPWTLSATFSTDDVQHTALWRINTKAQAVTALNDEATWLTETTVPAPSSPWRAYNTPTIDPLAPRRSGVPSGDAGGSSTPHPSSSIHPPVSVRDETADASDTLGTITSLPGTPTAPPVAIPTFSAPTQEMNVDSVESDLSEIDIDSVLDTLNSQRGQAQPLPDSADFAESSMSSENAESSESADESESATLLSFPQQAPLPVFDDIDREASNESGDLAAGTDIDTHGTHGDEISLDNPATVPTDEKVTSSEQTPATKQKKRRDRPTMPSWDEIVFGYSKD